MSARGVSAERMNRIRNIRTRYANNIRNANPAFAQATAMQRNEIINAQKGNGTVASQNRNLREARRIMGAAYNQQVSRRVYMGLSNG